MTPPRPAPLRIALAAGALALAALAAAAPSLAQPPAAKKRTGDEMMSNAQREQLARAGSAFGKKDAPIAVPDSEMVLVPPENILVVDTNKGRIVAELNPALAPLTVGRVQTLARQHFYDGLSFFRVINNFMDQTGDPQNTGEGGSKLPDLVGEFNFRRMPATGFVEVAQPEGLDTGFIGVSPTYSQSPDLMAMTRDGGVSGWGAFCPGVLGMARANTPDSANSQFFFMRDAYPSLEKRYAAFGRVVSGMDVVRAIKVGEPVAAPQDVMTRVRLASDLPPGETVTVRRQDPKGAAFKAQVEQAREHQGADFSVCDLALASKVS